MAALIKCLNCVRVKFGVLDMEMGTLPTSLNKMNKLSLQWNPVLCVVRFLSTLASMKSNVFRSLVENGSINWGERTEWVQSETWLIWRDVLTLWAPPQLRTACLTTWLGSTEGAEGVPFHLRVRVWPQRTGLDLDFINSFFDRRNKTLKYYIEEEESNEKSLSKPLARNSGSIWSFCIMPHK